MWREGPHPTQLSRRHGNFQDKKVPGRFCLSNSLFFNCLFFFFGGGCFGLVWLGLFVLFCFAFGHGIEPMPQQWPEPLQCRSPILNSVDHKRTPKLIHSFIPFSFIVVAKSFCYFRYPTFTQSTNPNKHSESTHPWLHPQSFILWFTYSCIQSSVNNLVLPII